MLRTLEHNKIQCRTKQSDRSPNRDEGDDFTAKILAVWHEMRKAKERSKKKITRAFLENKGD